MNAQVSTMLHVDQGCMQNVSSGAISPSRPRKDEVEGYAVIPTELDC